MQHRSTGYTLGFATAVCVVCSSLVLTAAVSLRSRQESNRLFDKQQKVLAVCGLLGATERITRQEAQRRFDENIQTRFVDLETAEELSAEAFAAKTGLDPAAYDPSRVLDDPALSRPAPPNSAGVRRLPRYAATFHVIKDGATDMVAIPVEGKGLWSTLYGYLALDKDGTTVRGIIFYEHAETPGLGGEVDNPVWKAKWEGRQAYDDAGVAQLRVIKGAAGTPEEDPFEVDGLSGATLTSRGVSNLIQFWLGDDAFGPYLAKFRNGRSAA